jgi:hypothetical protein
MSIKGPDGKKPLLHSIARSKKPGGGWIILSNDRNFRQVDSIFAGVITYLRYQFPQIPATTYKKWFHAYALRRADRDQWDPVKQTVMTASDRFVQAMNFEVGDDDMLDPEEDAKEAVREEIKAAAKGNKGEKVVDLTPMEAGGESSDDAETDVTSWREAARKASEREFSTQSVTSIQTIESRISILEAQTAEIINLLRQQLQQPQQPSQNSLSSQPGASSLPGSSQGGPGAG